MKGYIQVYTGNGKGKTTAAIGLSIRAAGAGKRVLFIQFVKGEVYSEIKALKRYDDLIEIHQYGQGCFIEKQITDEDRKLAMTGLNEVKRLLKKNNYEVVVLDEANIALYFGLFTIDELMSVIDCRPKGCEVIITGRYAPKELIELADLVTEMKEIKHYFTKGVCARKGIEK